MSDTLRKPWLVAVWPGMGAVAHLAGAHLVKRLGARPVETLDPAPFFELSTVAVHDGLVRASPLPQTVVHAWRDPNGARDLLIVVGEQQPERGADRYARALLDVAARYGVERVFTFAAMASPIFPGAEPRVFAAATTDALVAELRTGGVTLLERGEIGGLNGVFLAVAAERALPGTCLLGEFPFFAGNLPNPRAAAAVLQAFGRLSGVALDVQELVDDAGSIEAALRKHLERAQREASQATARAEAPNEESREARTERPADVAEEPAPEFELPEPPPDEPDVPPEQTARIEQLFGEARSDRAKALELKRELDRRGLFRRYEDRFLDLFRKAG
ncbi:MAG: PAC2 family protein [Planctomycetes bacterium]|nr:PAC2 family protein [Planctomycetota bacterium]